MPRRPGKYRERRLVIYGLFDPRDGACRYIGSTHNLYSRMVSHRTARSGVAKSAWIAELRRARRKPVPVVLEELPAGADAQEAERAWVQTAKEMGFRLTNHELVYRTYGSQIRPQKRTVSLSMSPESLARLVAAFGAGIEGRWEMAKALEFAAAQ